MRGRFLRLRQRARRSARTFSAYLSEASTTLWRRLPTSLLRPILDHYSADYSDTASLRLSSREGAGAQSHRPPHVDTRVRRKGPVRAAAVRPSEEVLLVRQCPQWRRVVRHEKDGRGARVSGSISRLIGISPRRIIQKKQRDHHVPCTIMKPIGDLKVFQALTSLFYLFIFNFEADVHFVMLRIVGHFREKKTNGDSWSFFLFVWEESTLKLN